MSNRLIVVSTLAVCASILLPLSARAADAAATECLTASENSYKLAKEHKLLEERAQLLVCAAAQCPEDVRKDCMQRVDDANRAIPSIVFEAKDSAGNDVSDVKITMDGTPLAERLDGTPITLDPGKHKFTFEIAGRAPIEKEYVILVSQKSRRESITFAPAPAKAGIAPAKPEPEPMASEKRPGLGNQRIAAIIAGGVGVVGVGVGSIFGLISKAKHNDAQGHCDASNACDPQGLGFRSSAIHAGNVSTVAFIVGAAGLAGGTALWFTAPHKQQESVAAIGIAPGGVLLKGTW